MSKALRMLCLAAVAAGASPLRAQDWVVRQVIPMNPHSLVANVDVHVAPNRDILVGFASPHNQRAVVARLSPGQAAFTYEQEDAPSVLTASFDWDATGHGFFASYYVGGTNFRTGEDLGPFGDLLSGAHPMGSQTALVSSVTMAVGPDGLPAVAAYSQTGRRFVSQFDVKSAAWITEFVGPTGPSAPAQAFNTQALVFDAAGQPALAYVSAANDLAVSRRDDSGWTDFFAGQADPALGVAVAADPLSRIGVAFTSDSNNLLFQSHDGSFSAPQLIAEEGGLLTPRSLAFDPQGNPAIVYSGATHRDEFLPLHLARRDAGQQWTDEVLPVNAMQASLAFDDAGNAYIAAITETGISLLTQRNLALAADFNLSGAVDGDDLAVWTGADSGSFAADADADGDSDGADFLVWQREVGLGLPAFPAATIPEPTPLALCWAAAVFLAFARQNKPRRARP